MAWITAIRRAAAFSVLILSAACLPAAAFAEGRSIVSGPYSLTLRGGAEGNSFAGALDGRADWLNPILNVHAFGSYEYLQNDRGMGDINSQKFGAGGALSHTFDRQVNLFAGSSWIHELGENFGQVYGGGKLRIFDRAILSASYGWGLGNRKDFDTAISAQAMSWYEVGVTVVPESGLKLSGFYSLIAPYTFKKSEVGGEVSYPVRDDVTAGVKGSISQDFGAQRLWKGFAFVTYALGGRKKDAIEVALDKNDPARFPKVVRFGRSTGSLSVSLSPNSPDPMDMTDSTRQFTAVVSGGTAPFTFAWSILANPGPFSLTSSSANPATASDSCTAAATRTLRVTVTDSQGRTGSASIAIFSTCGPA